MAAINSSTSIFSNPVVCALTVTVVVICGVEAWLSHGREGLFTRTARQRAAEMVRLPTPIVQIYGDSVSDSALDEVILEQALQLPQGAVRNYSIPGTTAYCAYPLLARQIAEGKVPRAIVLAYNPRSYTVPLTEKFLGRFATWPELWEAWRLGVPLETWLHSLACRISFSLRYRQELNSVVRSGAGWDFFDPQRTPVETIEQRRTRMAIASTPAPRNDAARDFNPEFHRAAFRRAREIDGSLNAFFTLARQHGIQVVMVSMPDPPGAHAHREANGFNRDYSAYLQGLADHHGAQLAWPQIDVLPATDFSDAVHLTRPAAHQLSQRLGPALRAAILNL